MSTPAVTGLSVSIANKPLPSGWNLNGLCFDAWLRLHHNNSLTYTQHPVESGANITDHSFVNPIRFSFDIGMTDCVKSIIPGQFPATPTRAINAYNTLVQLQAAREFLTLDSKYGHFDYILIESIDVSDDYQTVEVLKATINLVQIIVADSQLTILTLNPNATNTTPRGQVSSQPIPGSLEAIQKDLEELGTPAGFNKAAVNFLKNL